MNSSFRLFLTSLIFFTATFIAQGKPWWQAMDIETANHPTRFGYHVSRTDAQDKDRYVISIDPAAAVGLESANLFWQGGEHEVRKMEIIKIDGKTHIEFTVPPHFLQPSSFLLLNAAPTNYCGQEQLDNFMGYQLRLDNIPRSSAQDFRFVPSVKIVDGAFEFSYTLGEPAKISGPSPQSKPQVLAITMVNTIPSGLSLPLRAKSTGIEETVKFIIPKNQVADFMLVVSMTSQTDFTGAHAKQHYVGLGLLAANAELAAQSAPK